MIELLEGVPGAGKSYHAVAEYLLPWVRKGRRIYVYVDGFYVDRLAKFEGRSLEELEKQITLWTTGAEVLEGLTRVEPGSAVFIDECQTIFRAQQKLKGEILRWLETHRHYGIDVLLICQDYRQVTSGVTRVVEMTTKFRRLDRFGFKNRYQAFVRGNPEELEVIRGFTGTYDPKVYAYYGSYATATKEVRQVRSILRSPTIIFGAIGLLLACGWFFFGGGTFAGTVTAAPAKPAQHHQEPAQVPVPPTVTAEIHPIRIQGGMSMPRKGRNDWLWVSEDGRLLTVDEIAAESGGTVQSFMQRGVMVLKGSGVIWGGSPPAVPVTMPAAPLDHFAGPKGPPEPLAPPLARVEQEAPAKATGPSNVKDLLATDPKNDLLGNGTDLLR
jgi:hypothetical protein